MSRGLRLNSRLAGPKSRPKNAIVAGCREAQDMRQRVKAAVREGPENTRDSSFAEMQARIEALEAELAAARTGGRDRRGIAGHQFLARRPRPSVRRDAGKARGQRFTSSPWMGEGRGGVMPRTEPW